MGPAPLGCTLYYSTDVLVSQLCSLNRMSLVVLAAVMVALLIASELHYTYGVW